MGLQFFGLADPRLRRIGLALGFPNAVITDSIALSLVQAILNLKVKPPPELIYDVLQGQAALIEGAFEAMTGVVEKAFDWSDD